MIKVNVDMNKCQHYGQCVFEAPKVFKLNEEDKLEYVGETEKTVAAGTFKCRHFRFVDDSTDGMGGKTHPDYDIWVTADDDCILVYGSIDGYMMNRYELLELTR